MGRRWIAGTLLQHWSAAQPVHHRVASEVGLAQAEQAQQRTPRERLGQGAHARAVVGHLSGRELLVRQQRIGLRHRVQNRHPMERRPTSHAFRYQT